jgi:hypothetical protein
VSCCWPRRRADELSPSSILSTTRQPTGSKHGAPDAEERHVGDLGNVQSDGSGTVKLDITDKKISLFGKNSIVGRTLVIHAGTDDLGKGGHEESLKVSRAAYWHVLMSGKYLTFAFFPSRPVTLGKLAAILPTV